MLADDAEIRELSEPWLKQLEALLAGRRADDATFGTVKVARRSRHRRRFLWG